MHGLKDLAKRALPAGRRPRIIRTGFCRGVQLNLDLRYQMQVYLGIYERETFGDLHRLSRGCRSLIDLGAAEGELSIRFLRDPATERVVAAEPAKPELALLHANLALNGLRSDPRLFVHEGFAGDGSAGSRTLDDLAKDLPQPIFVKIDIEGAEAVVLAHGHKTLAGDCRLLVETHSVEAEHGCLDQLREMGYSTRIISPAWWRVLVPEHRGNIPHNRWLTAWRSEKVA